MKSIVNTMKTVMKELLAGQDRVIVAIDGKCGAGKSTLASELNRELDAQIIHMDDFFLQLHQRTEERRNEPGGNIDYERFWEEIICPLKEKTGQPLTYKPFDCHSLCFGDTIQVKTIGLLVLEGAYSCHPKWWDIADLHIFLDIDSDLQIQRIAGRNGMDAVKQFQDVWIPLENRYISTFEIDKRCDYYFKTL